jgi:2',3'-cyclic-nucleotide 2'-phosphodiesterase (5'-nucleotidase family)
MNNMIARTASDLIINEPGARMRDGKPVRIIQTTETNLGDLCADAYLNHFEGADIAIVNGDGIRADISRGVQTPQSQQRQGRRCGDRSGRCL